MPCSRSQHGLIRVGLEPPTFGSGVRGINHQATALPIRFNKPDTCRLPRIIKVPTLELKANAYFDIKKYLKSNFVYQILNTTLKHQQCRFSHFLSQVRIFEKYAHVCKTNTRHRKGCILKFACCLLVVRLIRDAVLPTHVV